MIHVTNHDAHWKKARSTAGWRMNCENPRLSEGKPKHKYSTPTWRQSYCTHRSLGQSQREH